MDFIAGLPTGLLAWLPTILFIWLIIFGFLLGMARGLRKSTIFVIKTLIAIGITFVIYFFIFLNHEETFNERIVIVVNGILGDGFMQGIFGVDDSFRCLGSMVAQSVIGSLGPLGESLLEIPEVQMYVAAMTQSIVSFIVFIVFVILYWIINHIFLFLIYLIFFRQGRKRKKINRKYDAGEVSQPYKNRRLAGGFIGLFAAGLKGLVYISFFLFFAHIVTGDNFGDLLEDESNSEVDTEMLAITNIYNFFRTSGDTGIVGILNRFRNSNNVPWILMIADMTARGNIYDEDGNFYEYVLLREEAAAITNITNMMMEHIIRNNLIDFSGDQNTIQMYDIINALLRDEYFEQVVMDAVSQFANTNVMMGLSRHILDSLFQSMISDSDNAIINALFGEESPLIFTHHILTRDNFSSVFSLALQTFRLLDDMNDGFSFIDSINLMDMLPVLHYHNYEINEILDTILGLGLLNDKEITPFLNEALASTFASLMHELVGIDQEELEEILLNVEFICIDYGTESGELRGLFNIVGDIVESGLLYYVSDISDQMSYVLNILTTSEGGNDALIVRVLYNSDLLYLIIASFITNLEIGDRRLHIPMQMLVEFADGFYIVSRTDIIVTLQKTVELFKHVNLTDLQEDMLVELQNIPSYVLEDMFYSRILQVMMANVIASGEIEILTVPRGFQFISEDDKFDDDILYKWIDTWESGNPDDVILGEARSIVNALITLGVFDILGDIASDDSDVGVDQILSNLLDLDSDEIDSIFESYLLRFFMSDILINMSLEMGIKVPYDVIYDCSIVDDEMISFDEFTAFFNAVIDLMNELNIEDISEIMDAFSIEEIANLVVSYDEEEAPIMVLFNSKIFTTTLGYMIYDLFSTSLEIPSFVLDEVKVIYSNEEENEFNYVLIVKEEELRSLINALGLIVGASDEGQLNVEEPEYILESIFTLIENNQVSNLFYSYIMWITVSQNIIDMSEGMLHIPTSVITDGTSKDNINDESDQTSNYQFIKVSELVILLELAFELTGGDSSIFEDLGEILEDLIENDDENFLERAIETSYIFSTTLGIEIIEIAGDFLHIPYDVVEQIEIVSNQSSNLTRNISERNVVTSEELISLLDVLRELDIFELIDSDDDLELNTIVELFEEEGSVGSILESSILSATFRIELILNAGGILYIPHAHVDLMDIYGKYEKVNAVTEEEFENFFNALIESGLFEYLDNGDIDINSIAQLFQDDDTRDVLFKSHIITTTLGATVVEYADDLLYIPYSVVDEIEVLYEKSTKYIFKVKGEELELFFYAFAVSGISNLLDKDDFGINEIIDIFDAHSDVLLDSQIISATFRIELINQSKGMLYIPFNNVEKIIIHGEEYKLNAIDENEFKNLLYALTQDELYDILIDNDDNISIEDIANLFSDDRISSILFESNIITVTLGVLVVNNAGDVIYIPKDTTELVNVLDDTNDIILVNAVNQEELEDFLYAIANSGIYEMLGENPDIDNLANIINDDDKRDTLFASLIITTTLGVLVIKHTSGIYIPYEVVNNVEVITSTGTEDEFKVYQDELEKFFNAIGKINLDILDDFNINVILDVFNDYSDELLASQIISATFRIQMHELDGLDMPAYPNEEVIQRISIFNIEAEGNNADEYALTPDEFNALLNILRIIMDNEDDYVEIDESTILRLVRDNDAIDVIMESYIMRFNISIVIIDLDVLVVPLHVVDDNGMIEYSELRYLLEAFALIAEEQGEEPSFDISLDVLLQLATPEEDEHIVIDEQLRNTELYHMLRSNILWYTISDIIIGLDGIDIPKDARESNELMSLDTEENYSNIKRIEIVGLLRAFGIIFGDAFDEDDIDISSNMLFDLIESEEDEKTYLYIMLRSSIIIWNKISYLINGIEALNIPFIAFDEVHHSRISIEEVVNLVKVFYYIADENENADLERPNFTFEGVLEIVEGESLDIISVSYIVWYMLSDIIITRLEELDVPPQFAFVITNFFSEHRIIITHDGTQGYNYFIYPEGFEYLVELWYTLQEILDMFG